MQANYVDYVVGKNQEWRIAGEAYSITDYKLINIGGDCSVERIKEINTCRHRVVGSRKN